MPSLLTFFCHSDHKEVHKIIDVIFLAILDILVFTKHGKLNINAKYLYLHKQI